MTGRKLRGIQPRYERQAGFSVSCCRSMPPLMSLQSHGKAKQGCDQASIRGAASKGRLWKAILILLVLTFFRPQWVGGELWATNREASCEYPHWSWGRMVWIFSSFSFFLFFLMQLSSNRVLSAVGMEWFTDMNRWSETDRQTEVADETFFW